MYFKIENKDSELYSKVMKFIKDRRSLKINNMSKAENLVMEITGLEVDQFDLMISQGGFNLIPYVDGIKLRKPSTTTPTGFMVKKGDKFHTPNGRTKLGRQLQSFFNNQKGVSYVCNLTILGLEDKSLHRFRVPYVEEFNGVIVALIDSQYEPKSTEDFIEITETEFNTLTKTNN